MFISCACPSPCLVHATTVPCRWRHCKAPVGVECRYPNGRRKPCGHSVREKTQQRLFVTPRNEEGRRILDKIFGPDPRSIPGGGT